MQRAGLGPLTWAFTQVSGRATDERAYTPGNLLVYRTYMLSCGNVLGEESGPQRVHTILAAVSARADRHRGCDHRVVDDVFPG
jgi:hypothetical protein